MELNLIQQQIGASIEPRRFGALPRRDGFGLSQRSAVSRPPIFSRAEMRHSFAIWAQEGEPASKRRLHLYYCLRCKWAFSVDDRTGSVVPMDQAGKPIQGDEGFARLATFGFGPCPVFDELNQERRLTQKVNSLESYRGRIASLMVGWRLGWRVFVRSCLSSLSVGGAGHRRNATK